MPPVSSRVIAQRTFNQSAVLLQRNAIRVDQVQPAPVLPDHLVFGIPGLPDATQDPTGNLFVDSRDRAQHWFLPEFKLPDGTDAAFGFAASKTAEIDQQTGAPFNKGRVSITLQKSVPHDIEKFRAANPNARLREIPLQALEAAILVETVSNGNPVSTRCPATLTQQADGHYLLVADAILGVSVVALFQNLTQTGTAKCVIAARFQAWRIKPLPPLPPGVFATMELRFEAGPEPFNAAIGIGSKFRADVYRLKFTVADNGPPRVIINADDLVSFDTHQSEYIELRALGDVTGRFPSISRLYFGVVSRTVVVIPNRYVILRNSGVCAALCNALVDSSPGLTAGCKFQFAFTLVPDVSPIDLILLTDEINARPEPELRGTSVQLPKSFQLGSGSRLVNPFLTSFSFGPGANDPHSMDLAAEIREQLQGQPAIANANMFIGQLGTGTEPFLTGSVGIRLDDAFVPDLDVPVLLSFTNTQPLDAGGMSLQVDSSGKSVLHNGSSFDLFVKRVGVVTFARVAIIPVGQTIAASQSLVVDVPANDGIVLVDGEIALKTPFTKGELFELLQFHTIDVQNTQYLFGIDATGVNFAGRAIDHLDVRITLVASPGVAVPPLLVRQERRADSARVLLPIDRALIELKAVASVSVSFTNPTQPPALVTLENDFGQHPVLILSDTNVRF